MNMMLNCRLFAVGCAMAALAVPVSIRAEGQAASSTPSLTLADALSIADAQNLSLGIAREEKNLADGKVTEARSAAMPHLDANAQYARLDDVPSFVMGEGPPFTMGQKDNYKAALEVSQVVYAGGGVQAALRMAREYRSAIDRRILNNRSEIAFQVHALFNQVLLAREQAGVAREAIALAEDREACLAAGIVEFRSLTDNNRTRTND